MDMNGEGNEKQEINELKKNVEALYRDVLPYSDKYKVVFNRHVEREREKDREPELDRDR